MKPIDGIILALVLGAMAAIVWRAIARRRRAKTQPAGCAGCQGCASAKNGGCAGCAYASQKTSKGGGCH